MKIAFKKLTEIDAFMKAGKFKRAIALVNVHLRARPRSHKAWNLLGWARLKTEDQSGAAHAFDEAIRLNPEWDNAYVGRGTLHRTHGELKQARACYRKAIRLCPKNAEALSSLCVVDLLQHRDKDAVRHAEEAWRLRKDIPSIPANLAIAYHYTGETCKRDRFYAIAKRKMYHNMKALDAIFSGKQEIR